MAIRLENVLYTVGGLFAAAAIIYFAWEYLFLLPRVSKTLLLILLIGVFFFLGNHLKERDV
jgi:hypothetical protein